MRRCCAYCYSSNIPGSAYSTLKKYFSFVQQSGCSQNSAPLPLLLNVIEEGNELLHLFARIANLTIIELTVWPCVWPCVCVCGNRLIERLMSPSAHALTPAALMSCARVRSLAIGRILFQHMSRARRPLLMTTGTQVWTLNPSLFNTFIQQTQFFCL